MCERAGGVCSALGLADLPVPFHGIEQAVLSLNRCSRSRQGSFLCPVQDVRQARSSRRQPQPREAAQSGRLCTRSWQSHLGVPTYPFTSLPPSFFAQLRFVEEVEYPRAGASCKSIQSYSTVTAVSGATSGICTWEHIRFSL
jgi:hypothetical protein